MDVSRPWYAGGLRFSCSGCGDCCTTHGDYAYVYLTQRDLDRISEYLEITRTDLLAEHCEADENGDLYLRMTPDDCPFLGADRRCTIYQARPKQCVTWPFWSENLEREVWHGQVEQCCRGVNKGQRHSREEIERIARDRDDWYER